MDHHHHTPINLIKNKQHFDKKMQKHWISETSRLVWVMIQSLLHILEWSI